MQHQFLLLLISVFGFMATTGKNQLPILYMQTHTLLIIYVDTPQVVQPLVVIMAPSNALVQQKMSG